MKHTPGPWIIGISVDATYGALWPVFRLRELGNPDPDGEEVKANALLIAAAPDLLAACEGLLAYIRNPSPFTDGSQGQHRKYVCGMADNALAKARGETIP